MTPRKDGDLQEKINDSRLQKNLTCKNFREVLILGGYVQNAASVEVEKHTYIFVYRYRYISVYMERDIGYTYRYLLTTLGKIPWRRKWQPTPVFLPGKSHGWWNLVGYSPWDHKELNTTERLSNFTFT